MGVYERWLVARGNVFLPSAATVAKLVEKLRAEKWIVDPASGELTKLRFSGKREEHAKATGGYAVKTVENTFGDDGDARIAASTEPLPQAITTEWLADDDRALIESSGFHELAWENETQKSLEAFPPMQDGSPAQQPAGQTVLWGPAFVERIRNMGGNLRSGALVIVQALFERV